MTRQKIHLVIGKRIYRELEMAQCMEIMISYTIFRHACRTFVMVRILYLMIIIKQINLQGSF